MLTMLSTAWLKGMSTPTSDDIRPFATNPLAASFSS